MLSGFADIKLDRLAGHEWSENQWTRTLGKRESRGAHINIPPNDLFPRTSLLPSVDRQLRSLEIKRATRHEDINLASLDRLGSYENT